MAQLVATQQVPTQGMPIKVINIMEGFLEVLARLFLAAPGALPALLDNNADALTRFLDRWLMVRTACSRDQCFTGVADSMLVCLLSLLGKVESK